MIWNVYRYSPTAKKVITFNVFDHCGFKMDAENALRKCKTKEELAKKVKSSLFCYFCSKYEWEIILSPYTLSLDKTDVKVDVYSQIMINWEHFINYIWSYKKQRKSSKPKRRNKSCQSLSLL